MQQLCNLRRKSILRDSEPLKTKKAQLMPCFTDLNLGISWGDLESFGAHNHHVHVHVHVQVQVQVQVKGNEQALLSSKIIVEV